ncbi:MAG: arginine--tRNA ligase [archaeon]
MIFKLKEYLQSKVLDVVKQSFSQLEVPVEITIPPKRTFGDYSTNVTLPIAKKTGSNTRDVAKQLVSGLGEIDLIERIEIAGNGFINFFLDYEVIAGKLLEELLRCTDSLGGMITDGQRVIVEHTSVNPNKAMHVGHLRNSVLGDALSSVLKHAGYDVVIQNYIDNTGVQVADVILALLAIKKEWYNDHPKEEDYDKRDYYYWDIYSWMAKKLGVQRDDPGSVSETDIDLVAKEKEIIHALENQEGEYFEMGQSIASEMVNAHLATNSRLGIYYDILVWESSIIKAKLWETALELLKKSDRFVFKESGDNEGCWVLEYGSDREDKIFIRSDGTTVYVAKDFAFHLWKFGLVEDPFKYFIWSTQTNGKKLYSTFGKESVDAIDPANADEIINVIGGEQKYEQTAVANALGCTGHAEQESNYHHLAYGSVSLSRETIEALGIEVTEDRKSYPMSGRKGIGIKVDDLIDRMIQKIMEDRKDEKEFKIDEETAKQIAIGAIRYFMLKVRYSRELVFDFDQALQTNGNTGVYLQYSLARAQNILKKSGDDVELDRDTKFNDLSEHETALINQMIKFHYAIKNTVDSNDPSFFADYVYNLATVFSSFYNNSPNIIKTVGDERKRLLIIVKIFTNIMTKSLDILGIPTLSRM